MTVVPIGDEFWQINCQDERWWTAKRITQNPDDWLLINHHGRRVPNYSPLGRILIRWVQKASRKMSGA